MCRRASAFLRTDLHSAGNRQQDELFSNNGCQAAVPSDSGPQHLSTLFVFLQLLLQCGAWSLLRRTELQDSMVEVEPIRAVRKPLHTGSFIPLCIPRRPAFALSAFVFFVHWFCEAVSSSGLALVSNCLVPIHHTAKGWLVLCWALPNCLLESDVSSLPLRVRCTGIPFHPRASADCSTTTRVRLVPGLHPGKSGPARVAVNQHCCSWTARVVFRCFCGLRDIPVCWRKLYEATYAQDT